jgi:PAS domain S-box-containing protein
MTEGDDAGAVILKALKYNPRGLTVTDISKKIGCHRNSTGKQLEILRAGGKVDVRQIGSARVYSLSQRVPLSAFLCFTKNIILIVDQDLNVVQANDQYLNLSGLNKEELIGRNIHEGTLPIVSTPEALGIIESTGKQQVVTELSSGTGKNELYYKMEVIPTTFEDGEPGLTILFEDITERKQHLKNMEFLARTAMELVDMPPDTDIYRYIGDRLVELIPENPRIYVHSYDDVKGEFFFRAVKTEEVRQGTKEVTGFDPVGVKWPVKEYFYAPPFSETAASFKDMREMHFKPFYDEEDISFYDACAHIFSKEDCEVLLRKFDLAKIYLTGLVWQEQLFGLVGICLGREEELENKQAIESFLRQASIAIARRLTEERLLRSEQRFAELVSNGVLPATVVVRDGRISLVNPKFTETFGYIKDDIPTLQEWVAKAVLDPEHRSMVLSSLDPGQGDKGDRRSPVFSVRCWNGNEKQAEIHPVFLSDGTQVITCHVKDQGR